MMARPVKKSLAGAVCACALLIAAPLTWIGGEAHKRNCIRQGHAGCTTLPWNNGKTRPPKQAAAPWGCQFKTEGGPCLVPLP